MKYKKGFTIIEITVTVAIIAILATFVGMSLTGQQVKARDAARSSKVTIIADALERYYDKHGEYPSVRSLLNTYSGNTGSAVASLLSINEKTTLVMPGATAGTTNSIAASVTSNDTIAYVASSAVGNDNCQSSAQGGCDQYTLSYKKESDGSIVNVESQKRIAIADNVNPLQAPTKPTITASQSGTSLTATSSAPACSTSQSMTPRYAFKTQTGTGSWSSWSAWQTSSSYTLASNVDTTSYSFQVHVRCESSAAMSDTSSDSDTTSITYYTPPATPSTPTVTATLVSGRATGSSSAVVCDYGTGEYRIDYRTNDGAWNTGTWRDLQTGSLDALDGTKYGFRGTTRCINGTQTSTSATSTEATYIDPITTPSAPTPGSAATYLTKTWTWTASACAAGTSPRYQYQFSYWNGTSWLPGTSWIATDSATATNVAATSQGIKYGININQQCYNSYTTSGWSTSPGSGSFSVPVVHVQANYAALMMGSDGYPYIKVKNYTGSCASGLTRYIAIKADYDNAGVWAYDAVAPLPDSNPNSGGVVATDGITLKISQTIASGHFVEISPRIQCKNDATGARADADGQVSLDKLYDNGNMYNQGSSKYNLSCPPVSGQSSYCAGGYNSSGTKNSTNSTLLACNVKSSGISDTATRYTARYSFGTANPCWNA